MGPPLAPSAWGKDIRFAPIYDSGSSLGRENSEEKIKNMLRNKVQFDAYIAKGKSEIHWEGNKIKHFELVETLLKNSTTVKTTIENFQKNFTSSIIETYILNIDSNLPKSFLSYSISDYRKDFIIKSINLRLQKLKAIII